MGNEAITSSSLPRSPRRRNRPAPPPFGSFRELSDDALDALQDADLVAYIARARRGGHNRAAGRALAILTWGYEPYIVVRVSRKVPEHAVETVVQKVLDSVEKDALEGRIPFTGSVVPEFRGWLDRIVRRRIADYHRDPRSRMTRMRLAEDVEEDAQGVQLVARDDAAAVPDQLLVREALNALSPRHREVARMSELDGHSAAEIASAIPGISPSNVYKIGERFRTQVTTMVTDAENAAGLPRGAT